MLSLDHIEAPYLRDIALPEATPRVVVAGAYEGDTIAFIRYYHPATRVIGYEPQDFAYRKLRARFREDDRVDLSPYAIGVVDVLTEVILYEAGTDAASVCKLENSRAQAHVWMQPAVNHLRYMGYAFIDLFVMNIEGYEYSLIPELLYNKDIFVREFLIQFHFKESRVRELEAIQDAFIACNYYKRDIGRGWETWQR